MKVRPSKAICVAVLKVLWEQGSQTIRQITALRFGLRHRLSEVDLDDVDVSPEEVADVRKAMEMSLQDHVKQLSDQSSKHIQKARAQIIRHVRMASPETRRAIEELNFRKVIKAATADASPVVRRVVEAVDVQETIEHGLAAADEAREKGPGRVRANLPESEARAASLRRARDATLDLDRRYDQLERRLARLTEELDDIRREMSELRDD